MLLAEMLQLMIDNNSSSDFQCADSISCWLLTDDSGAWGGQQTCTQMTWFLLWSPPLSLPNEANRHGNGQTHDWAMCLNHIDECPHVRMMMMMFSMMIACKTPQWSALKQATLTALLLHSYFDSSLGQSTSTHHHHHHLFICKQQKAVLFFSGYSFSFFTLSFAQLHRHPR